MKTKLLFSTLLTLSLLNSARAQALDKAKLDQLFDRLLEKNGTARVFSKEKQ
jgi:hypothetical protein